jgi:hypothetical protein
MAGSNGSGGSAGSTTTGGSAGVAGGAGAGGQGGAGMDASADVSVADGSPDATNEGDVGFPEASTCAGYALDLDGFSAFAFVNRVVQDDFTLEAWIKAGGPSPVGNNFWNGHGIIYADTPANNNDFGTSIINDHFSIGTGNPGGAEPTLQGLTDVTTGQWFHVAATRRESTGELQIYVYGQLEASLVTANHNPLTAAASINLGADTIDAHYFMGQLDEIRIWNVVRTQTELQSTMHQLLTGTEPGLVGYWRFDEPGAVTAIDSSPTHADATLFGSVNWVPSDAPVCAARRDAGPPDVQGPPDASE